MVGETGSFVSGRKTLYVLMKVETTLGRVTGLSFWSGSFSFQGKTTLAFMAAKFRAPKVVMVVGA